MMHVGSENRAGRCISQCVMLTSSALMSHAACIFARAFHAAGIGIEGCLVELLTHHRQEARPFVFFIWNQVAGVVE